MKIDLHAHTTHSDGTFAPADLIAESARRGVGVQAVTDHDTVGGVPEAEEAGLRLGVRIVWGVEFSARDPGGGGDVHVLGFFPGRPPQAFLDLLDLQRGRRRQRAEAIMARLAGLGMPITWEDLRAAGASDDSVGRPHLAKALLAKGHVASFSEAFRRWIAPGMPAYAAHEAPQPGEAIRLILEAGGVPVAAHPAKIKDPAVLEGMIAAGLRGIEAYHPDHDAARAALFARLARERGLIATGGADFHGVRSDRSARPGDHPTPPEEFARLASAFRSG